jgi:hypothetical protein
MPTFAEIREGLAANLATLAGVAAYATVQPELDAPATVVGPFRSSEPRGTLGRRQPGAVIKATWIVPVRVYMGNASEVATQDDLDVLADWNSAGGIVKVIESDPTLGGIADGVRVLELSKYGTFDVGKATFLGFEATVEVLA